MSSMKAFGWKQAVTGVALAAASLTCHGQTAVNGPYYATPSWDQSLPGSTRFLVLSNFNSDAVLDRETGLVWQRQPQIATGTYGAAFSICGNLRTGGRLGWRLPTLSELTSLFDPSATVAPALPPGHPFTGLPTGLLSFWSTTTGLIGTTPSRHVWVTGLFSGQIIGNIAETSESNQGSSWCVRGGGYGGTGS